MLDRKCYPAIFGLEPSGLSCYIRWTKPCFMKMWRPKIQLNFPPIVRLRAIFRAECNKARSRIGGNVKTYFHVVENKKKQLYRVPHRRVGQNFSCQICKLFAVCGAEKTLRVKKLIWYSMRGYFSLSGQPGCVYGTILSVCQLK